MATFTISVSMSDAVSFWTVVGRSLKTRCPKCGKGHLLRRYLTQNDDCANCGEHFGHISADDGPAWLTIILVGHILAPVLLYVLPNSTWPEWALMLFWPGLAFIMMLLLLPPCKGLFIGLIWRNKAA